MGTRSHLLLRGPKPHILPYPQRLLLHHYLAPFIWDTQVSAHAASNTFLTSCKARPRELALTLANDLWKRRCNSPLPHRLGDILGCGLAEFRRNNEPDKGKNRLYRILVSETAYLIWKMRNERRIRDEDSPGREASEREISGRWTPHRGPGPDKQCEIRQESLVRETGQEHMERMPQQQRGAPNRLVQTQGGFSGYLLLASPKAQRVRPCRARRRTSPTHAGLGKCIRAFPPGDILYISGVKPPAQTVFVTTPKKIIALSRALPLVGLSPSLRNQGQASNSGGSALQTGGSIS